MLNKNQFQPRKSLPLQLKPQTNKSNKKLKKNGIILVKSLERIHIFLRNLMSQFLIKTI